MEYKLLSVAITSNWYARTNIKGNPPANKHTDADDQYTKDFLQRMQDAMGDDSYSYDELWQKVDDLGGYIYIENMVDEINEPDGPNVWKYDINMYFKTAQKRNSMKTWMVGKFPVADDIEDTGSMTESNVDFHKPYKS